MSLLVRLSVSSKATLRRMTVLTALALGVAALLLMAPEGPSRLGASIAQAAGKYLDGFEDLPLMPGMSPMPGESLIFDKPGGRIVQAAAQGRVKEADVQKFYAQTMPQLGWRPVAINRFERDGEFLKIEFPRASGHTLTVRFTLSPNTPDSQAFSIK
ncbi:Carboxypeptidase regulatory-like domain-containing protein [Azospirillaceae bacterium]